MTQKELVGELFWFLIDEYVKRKENREYNEVVYDLNNSMKYLKLIINS